MNYQVGQIVYTCSNKSMNIIPLQIVEEITRTSLTGTEKNYLVRFPNKQGTTTELTKIKGRLFSSISAVKTFMINNSNEAIEKMIKNAEELKSLMFNLKKDDLLVEKVNAPANAPGLEKDNKMFVELENGVKANIDMSQLEKLKLK